jgi:hypothetical protein
MLKISNIFDEYKIFFEKGYNPDLINSIITSKKIPDLSNLINFHEKSKSNENKKMKMRSSSSSGICPEYNYGPSIDILQKIEIQNKVQNREIKVVRILNNSFTNIRNNFSFRKVNGFLGNYNIGFSCLNYEIVKKIIESLCTLKEEKVAIFSHPHFYLFANEFDLFRDYIIKNKIILISTDYSSFFKKKYLIENGVQINDCTINWKNGVNFYHCEYNKTHITPIFALWKDGLHSSNLVNLSSNPEEITLLDDNFNFIESEICLCGKFSYILDFVPHKKYSIYSDEKLYRNLNLIEDLSGRYQNLQFIQNENEIDCLHICENMPSNDKELIVHYFDQFKVNFITNKFLHTGIGKLDFFYKNIRNLPFSDILY